MNTNIRIFMALTGLLIFACKQEPINDSRRSTGQKELTSTADQSGKTPDEFGSDSDPTHTPTTPSGTTPPPSAQGMGFLTFGDFGTGESEQYQVAQGIKSFCASNDCQFIAGLGDNIYDDGVSSVTDAQWQTKFEKPYAVFDIVFRPSLGNHDVRKSAQAQIDYSKVSKKWDMPARYYSFVKGNATFFVIDTNDFSATQQLWLSKGLQDANTPWKIVYGHHPIYSYGEHGNTAGLDQKLLPILRDKAQFYLAGHDHDMQVLDCGNKLTCVISGAAAKLRPTDEGTRTLYAKSILGFTHIQIKGDVANLRMLDAAGKQLYQREITRAY